jgi:hypothetical protein
MGFLTPDHVQTMPALSKERPSSTQPVGWWFAWGASVARRLVIGLGSLAVFGVASVGTWLTLAGVALSFVLESGYLHQWEDVSEWIVIFLLGGVGVYGLLMLLR